MLAVHIHSSRPAMCGACINEGFLGLLARRELPRERNTAIPRPTRKRSAPAALLARRWSRGHSANAGPPPQSRDTKIIVEHGSPNNNRIHAPRAGVGGAKRRRCLLPPVQRRGEHWSSRRLVLLRAAGREPPRTEPMAGAPGGARHP
jgi:hypothetical protein